jgi:hypothetical protein
LSNGGEAQPTPTGARSVLSEQPSGSLAAGRIHRFIKGIDEAPKAMSDAEVAQELNDPFATLLLRKGSFPTTTHELLAALDAEIAPDDNLRRQMSFLVGEGSQIPFSQVTSTLQRGLRLAITRGADSAVDVLVSTDGKLENEFLQVIGWDEQSGVFNYYQHMEGAWVWAGNSTHAFDSQARGNGAFDSHINGSMVMKELKFPWNHWHSVAASIPPEVFAPDDQAKSDPLIAGRSGAEVLQERVVEPGVRRWTNSRFSKEVTTDGKLARVTPILEQLFTTTSVNLTSSSQESRTVEKSTTQLALPASFFVDVDALSGALELPPPPTLAVTGEAYLDILTKFDVALVDDQSQFRQLGDTHFAFLVPERAFEDLDVVRKCRETGLLSDRFIACALMVDFPNPVFSTRRSSLLAHLPSAFDGPAGGLSAAAATAIVDAAASGPATSPENEFAQLWNLGEGGWKAEAQNRLVAYYQALTTLLGSTGGFEGVFKLAESRRNQVMGLQLSEGRPLLFAKSNIPSAESPLRMRPDAGVEAEPA